MLPINTVMRTPLRSIVAAATAVALTALTAVTGGDAAHATGVTPTLRWQHDISARIQQSAPTIADVNGDGEPEIVVGDLEGMVHVYRSDGVGELAGWPQAARVDGVHATAVESPPAVADLDGDGHAEIIVGATSVWAPNQQGGLVVFDRTGRLRWHWQGIDYITIWGTTSFHHDGYSEGAVSAPAIGDVDGDGHPDIVFGTFEARIHALDRNGRELAGFPYQADDTVWSSAALVDDDHDGRKEIFIGSPSTGGGPQPHMGGTMFALDWQSGRVVTRWRRNISESIDATPAIGDVDGDGRLEAVTTTGWAFNNAASRSIFAWHLNDGSALPGFPVDTGVLTTGSPALGDVNNDGRPEIVVGGWDGVARVYRGNGTRLWASDMFAAWPNRDKVEADPVIADVDGDNDQDVVMPTNLGVFVLDGRTGAKFAGPLSPNWAFHGAPAVAFLDGAWSLVAAGFRKGWPAAESDVGTIGRVAVWSLGSLPARAEWPMARHDPLRRGTLASISPSAAWRCSHTGARGAHSNRIGNGAIALPGKGCAGNPTRIR